MTKQWAARTVIIMGTAVFVGTAAQSAAEPASATLDVQRPTRSGSKEYKDAVKTFITRAEPKVVGGQVAPDGAFPYQVSLGVSWIANPGDAHFCGGSIYKANWIVTAAHCVTDTQPENIAITAGTNKLDPGTPRYNVQRIIVHKGYSVDTSDNDIALLELRDPLPISPKAQTIAILATADEPGALQDGHEVVVTGWGATREGGAVVRNLRFVKIPVLDRAICNQPTKYNGQITNNMVCAGQLSGGTDSCQGDSGGPLASGMDASRKLAGIVSWGEGCARPNKVGVYTRAAKYSAWVSSCTDEPTNCNR
jgi:secreted trypsin-like serine protease